MANQNIVNARVCHCLLAQNQNMDVDAEHNVTRPIRWYCDTIRGCYEQASMPMYAYVPFEGAHVCLCPIGGCYDTGFFQVGGSTPRDPHHVHDSVVHLAQRE